DHRPLEVLVGEPDAAEHGPVGGAARAAGGGQTLALRGFGHGIPLWSGLSGGCAWFRLLSPFVPATAISAPQMSGFEERCERGRTGAKKNVPVCTGFLRELGSRCPRSETRAVRATAANPGDSRPVTWSPFRSFVHAQPVQEVRQLREGGRRPDGGRVRGHA